MTYRRWTLYPRCAVCFRFTLRRRMSFTGTMTARLCRGCTPIVCAIDVGGCVQAIEKEFSRAFVEIRKVA